MDDVTQDTIDALDDLLEAERAALLQGQLDEVSRLHQRKEQLIEHLSQLDVQSRAEFDALDGKVKRNQDLLNSALGGLRSVARRLATIRRVRQSLETYDSAGKKHTVDVRSTGSLEKRA